MMTSFMFGRYALTIGIAAGLLAGCAAQGSSDMRPPISSSGFEQSSHRTSWMSPGAKSIKALLYVSDWNTNDVFVYDYNNGTLEGQLSGSNEPYGQCVDKNGNVWIVAYGASSVSEYAHGGSKPMATLKTDYEPMGCSVDPTTGNLAVATSHEIEVFAHARGKAHEYQSNVCFPFWAPGYDSAGNLYAEALLYGSAKLRQGYTDPLACELPRGGRALRPVQFKGFFIVQPASVMWDGEHLTLTDQNYLGDKGNSETAIYRVKEDSSGNLTSIGRTILTDTCNGKSAQVPQPFIIGKTVVGGNLTCFNYGSLSKVDYWNYPTGGNPTFSLQSPPIKPVGQSVSIAP
jgi:hypothetical protein